VVEKIFTSGYDAKVFAQDLLEELRNTLMVRLSPGNPSRLVDLPDSEIAELISLTAQLSDEDLHMLFDMCLKSVNDLLRAQDPRIVLEMSLLRMAAAPRIVALAELLNSQAGRLSQNTKASPLAQIPTSHSIPLVTAQTVATQPAPGAAPSNPGEKRFTAASFMRAAPGYNGPLQGAQTTSPAPVSADAKASESTPRSANTEEPVAKKDPAKANDPWSLFVDQVSKTNTLLGAMLENTHMISNDGAKLLIGLPKKMSFMFDKIKDPENIKRVETFIETFWSKRLQVEVKIADEKAEAPSPKVAAEEKKATHQRSVETAVEQNALVQQAQNVFKTQIKSIQDMKNQETKSKGRPQ
jgi:DNA polymerase-3 subunit gamma/tau